MSYLAPSVLSADFSVLGKEVTTAVDAGADWIHLDVMDGEFVPNITIGACVISCIRKVTKAFFDVHLMVEEPVRCIDEYALAGADMITVHYEACSDVKAVINKIHSRGIKAGLAIKPDTDAESIKPFIGAVDMILVMTVYPGFGGQKYIETSTEKIKKVRAMMAEAECPEMLLEVDGGLIPDNIKIVENAGANVFVVGSAVFEGDIRENIANLKRQL